MKSVLLAKDFEKVKNKKPITEYYASEKFDGYRAIWNGEKFLSRVVRIYCCPRMVSKIYATRYCS